MLKIAICDDDIPLCTHLEEIVKNHCTSAGIDFEVIPFYQGEDLLDTLTRGITYDLIFLDIEINTITGIEVGSAIRNKLDDHISKIVFITSKEGYEQELFAVQPLNFLKKPLDIQSVGSCIDLALKITRRESLFFEYKIGYEVHKEKFEGILYFETQGRKVKMVTLKGDYSFYGKLSEVKEQLPNTFVQIHKSYLANINLSSQISSDSMKMVNEDVLPISQRNISQVRKLLLALSKEKRHDKF